MKYISLIAILLLAVEAVAVETVPIQSDGLCHKHNNVWKPTNGRCDGNIFATTEQPDCLAQMEAAMRAMDEFGPSLLLKVFMSGTAYGKGMLKEKDAGDWMREAVQTQKQWDAAKACWRTP